MAINNGEKLINERETLLHSNLQLPQIEEVGADHTVTLISAKGIMPEF
jgi:hypothetical protein